MTPLRPATSFKSDVGLVEELAKLHFDGDIEAARAHLDAEREKEQIWVNEIYQVATIKMQHKLFGDMMQINIRRRDGNVIFRDWRHFQEIKNQLAGPECQGIELYPPESDVIDTANKYHIWVFLNPEIGIPIGWHEGRHVSNGAKGSKLPGNRQRPLPPHWKESE
jgi:hypothetical protein